MDKKIFHVIGVMSGTSLDGIDIAYLRFEKSEKWNFKIIEAETHKYSIEWKNKLKNAINLDELSLKKLDKEYSVFLAQSVSYFIKKFNIINLNAVCSHGHTVFHMPRKGITYQIGNKQVLANLLQHTVICDFRVQDVKLGGQGAPLVPIGDELLFGNYDYCLNLGGFANISTKVNNTRIAYDVCPANIVLNHYASKLGVDYDENGRLAASGNLDNTLLNYLDGLPYYQKEHPKSLGLEWVKEKIFPFINEKKTEIKDILHTFTQHIVNQTAKTLEDQKKVLVSGGGAYNTYLINMIKQKSDANIIIPSNKIIEYKEALIFGFLGVLKLENEVNCLSSVTGAKKDHSSGVIFNPMA
ncbi:anhydro-N-acetylmuramic acid kinase [Abyssalbus ytuae]|uniref:Anhydro-N-acetylmuramic acid kinase n=1 Tax=Abyssalbus ytuae TaxID=2926907 RepID=A0A9E7CYI9_9FLAO|nr:anhydro-N-acetylmuramic acid kinase [Abyssalbus ytuae]UOB16705.1 anhydro-N-acetylmuramic acid kinase [Abyssalbus ytuae]